MTPRTATGSIPVSLLVALVASASGIGCTHTDRSSQPVTPQVTDSRASSAPSTSFSFENPGGMWLPTQIAEHAETLRKLGVAFVPETLSDPTAFPLGAIVSLGGCSASFVSASGLLVTNHHCVTGALQHNSRPDRNLLVDGYLASTSSDELSAGPSARAYATVGYTDVTEAVLSRLDGISDPKTRHDTAERAITELEAKCEEGRDHIDCDVDSFFGGSMFYQIEYLALRDIRLVYAPNAGIGVFGGEIDNWRWPRHTGDFAFLRAYVAPDGSSAEYSVDNVPFKPAHHLRIATEPLQPGDFAMVAGYPGRTYRFRTAAEVQDAVQWSYPHRLQSVGEQIELLERLAATDKEVALAAATRLRRLHNAQTNYNGMLDGLAKDGLAARKAAQELELQGWIEADPARRAKYGTVLTEMAKVNAAKAEHRQRDEALERLAEASTLLTVARAALAEMEKRQKPESAATAAAKKDRDAFEKGVRNRLDKYNAVIDRALLELAIKRALALPQQHRPSEALAAFFGPKVDLDGIDDAAIAKTVDALYKRTKLTDPASVVRIAKLKSIKQAARSADPLVRVAALLKPRLDVLADRDDALSGQLELLRPLYVEALREHSGKPMAPDANSTLRITFGTVRGYRPKPGADVYEPFTTLSQMLAKHKDAAPFDVPDTLLTAAKNAQSSPYFDPALGDVPLDFLADLDITGGNSGSATLNAKGELIGLAFDGNYESMASDWLFVPEVTRSIHVDARYMLWVMDDVDQADHLIREMGLQPRPPG